VDRLASWKEIAAHLGVTARTAQRWERLEGLPVHRQMHATLGSAYALRCELEAWRAGRSDRGALQRSRSRPGRSVVVLPFANLTRDLETEILADGLTEEVISALAHVPGLGVVARTSAFYFKNRNVDVREVGATLGVDTVLEGSLRSVEGRIRAVAQLIDARTGLHLWSEPFESSRTDLLGLQRDLAHAIAGTLRATLSSGEEQAGRHGGESGAYVRYLEGMYHWNRRTPEGFLRAVECFEGAVTEAPGLAVAWAALAGCYGNAGVTSTLPPAEARERAL
jgi:TolB-like protein